jgi:hypothetical protein
MPLLALLPGAESGSPVVPHARLPVGSILVTDAAHWTGGGSHWPKPGS